MSNDRYCYPGTNVLINKLGLRTTVELEAAENIMLFVNSARARELPPPHDAKRLKAIHRTLFGNFLDWAGEVRQQTCMMAKMRQGKLVSYANSQFIEAQLEIVFSALRAEKYLTGLSREQFAVRLAHYYGELDTIHAFREGNSRTLRQFTRDLARDAGHLLDWSLALTNEADRQALFAARDRAVVSADAGPLVGIMLRCLTPLPRP